MTAGQPSELVFSIMLIKKRKEFQQANVHHICVPYQANEGNDHINKIMKGILYLKVTMHIRKVQTQFEKQSFSNIIDLDETYC